MSTIYRELLDFAFREGPIFRQRYDDHVSRWINAKRRELWLVYHADAQFRNAYEAEVLKRRAAPMPDWQVAA